jgi:hypothetical protein
MLSRQQQLAGEFLPASDMWEQRVLHCVVEKKVQTKHLILEAMNFSVGQSYAMPSFRGRYRLALQKGS